MRLLGRAKYGDTAFFGLLRGYKPPSGTALTAAGTYCSWYMAIMSATPVFVQRARRRYHKCLKLQCGIPMKDMSPQLKHGSRP